MSHICGGTNNHLNPKLIPELLNKLGLHAYDMTSCSSINTKANFTVHVIITTITISELTELLSYHKLERLSILCKSKGVSLQVHLESDQIDDDDI